ncbi:MAG: hypothetical protein NTV52_21295 [Acidobacteria bacterium]|nr:hypothetical protein [Acidobacteriota bacterium]
MAIFHLGYVTSEMIESEVEAAIKKLGPEVVRLRYNFEFESGESPCINFHIVITGAASRQEVLGEVTSRIRQVLIYDLEPIEEWGPFPYFSFRNQSEQAQRNQLDLNWV